MNEQSFWNIFAAALGAMLGSMLNDRLDHARRRRYSAQTLLAWVHSARDEVESRIDWLIEFPNDSDSVWQNLDLPPSPIRTSPSLAEALPVRLTRLVHFADLQVASLARVTASPAATHLHLLPAPPEYEGRRLAALAASRALEAAQSELESFCARSLSELAFDEGEAA